MDPRVGIRPAPFPVPRRSEAPRAAVLACAVLALRTIRSRVGFVVLGLDQRGTSPHRVWNRSGLDPVCRDAAQSAAGVVVFFFSVGSYIFSASPCYPPSP